MFDFFNGPHVVPRGTYDPNIIISDKLIHILISVHVEFHEGNKIFKKYFFGDYLSADL